MSITMFLVFFFFNDTATTEIYTLSLHDALPISGACAKGRRITTHRKALARWLYRGPHRILKALRTKADRKSTRLNSSHSQISYAVFCLKKKKKKPAVLHSQQSEDTRVHQSNMQT